MALARNPEQPEPGKGRTRTGSDAVPSGMPARPNAVFRGATRQYQRTQVETASPTRLVILLYDGAVRFCHLAQDAMRKGDLESQNTNLIKAQRIVSELLSSLNRDAGGEIASNLARIYAHLLEELVKANLYDQPEILDHAISMLNQMRASWVEIERSSTLDMDALERPSVALTGDSPLIEDSNSTGREAAKPRIHASLKAAPTTGFDNRLGDRLA